MARGRDILVSLLRSGPKTGEGTMKGITRLELIKSDTVLSLVKAIGVKHQILSDRIAVLCFSSTQVVKLKQYLYKHVAQPEIVKRDIVKFIKSQRDILLSNGQVEWFGEYHESRLYEDITQP